MKISFSTIMGFVLGLGAFVFAVWEVTGGFAGVVMFANAAAAAVVLGGTVAATMISYEWRYVVKALRTQAQVFVPTSVNAKSLFGTVELVIGWGKIGARDGLLALESEFKKVDTDDDPFLAHCIQLFLAGYDKDNLRQKLNTFIAKSYERNMVQATILNTMANISPGFGMIGTLVGLVAMLATLDPSDPSGLGSSLSVALLTTLYGTMFAQLVFKPASRRAEQKEQIQKFKNQLIADGFLLLLTRANSVEIQDHLNSYLDPAIHFDIAQAS